MRVDCGDERAEGVKDKTGPTTRGYVTTSMAFISAFSATPTNHSTVYHKGHTGYGLYSAYSPTTANSTAFFHFYPTSGTCHMPVDLWTRTEHLRHGPPSSIRRTLGMIEFLSCVIFTFALFTPNCGWISWWRLSR